jgi:hypothetical protein
MRPGPGGTPQQPDSGHIGTISITAQVRWAEWNAMKPRIQCVQTQLVFRSYAAAACQAARTAVICSGSG